MVTRESCALAGMARSDSDRCLFDLTRPLPPSQAAAPEVQEHFARQLAALADVYVNDAFGSWQVRRAKHR